MIVKVFSKRKKKIAMVRRDSLANSGNTILRKMAHSQGSINLSVQKYITEDQVDQINRLSNYSIPITYIKDPDNHPINNPKSIGHSRIDKDIPKKVNRIYFKEIFNGCPIDDWKCTEEAGYAEYILSHPRLFEVTTDVSDTEV